MSNVGVKHQSINQCKTQNKIGGVIMNTDHFSNRKKRLSNKYTVFMKIHYAILTHKLQ